jgi:NADH:ubiquinone oxidoreductase subunit C
VTFLKESPDFRMDYLSSVTGADYLQFLESVYHLYSMALKIGPVMLRVRVSREDPRVPSLTPLFRGAEFQEREAYDMYGIVYMGHPDPRRLFMWDGFEGFPMRKDYQQEDVDVLEADDIEWLDRHGVPVPDGLRQVAEELRASGQRAVARRAAAEEE